MPSGHPEYVLQQASAAGRGKRASRIRVLLKVGLEHVVPIVIAFNPIEGSSALFSKVTCYLQEAMPRGTWPHSAKVTTDNQSFHLPFHSNVEQLFQVKAIAMCVAANLDACHENDYTRGSWFVKIGQACYNKRMSHVRCYHCNEEIDTDAIGVYRKVVCWLRNRPQGGSNSATLPSPPIAWSCFSCIERIKLRGPEAWDTEQNSLF